MNGTTHKVLLKGAAGAIEVAIDAPASEPRGLAVVAHPHPLFGGTFENKVVHTLARAFVALGYRVARPNFRGVGGSEGTHDEGRGEVDDLIAVVEQLNAQSPQGEVVLAGFSFGSFVQTHVAARLAALGRPARRLVLVGLAVSRWTVLPVAKDSVIIHGENDDTVPLAAVLDWARPLDLAIIVIPGADHFFHRKLTTIKRIVLGAWQGEHAAPVSESDAPE
jgi:alpha/beta superfamily hydrolase